MARQPIHLFQITEAVDGDGHVFMSGPRQVPKIQSHREISAKTSKKNPRRIASSLFAPHE